MTLRLRTSAAAATLAVLVGAGACSSADPESAPSGTATAPAASAPPSSGSATSAPGASGATAAPTPDGSAPGGSESASDAPQQSTAPTVDSFPKPPGMKVAQSGSIGSAGFALAGTVSDPQAAYDYWVEELPKAGWTLGEHTFAGQGTTAIGSIEFTGPGFGGSTIGIFGTRVAIAVQN